MQHWNGQNDRPGGGWSHAGGLALDFSSVSAIPNKIGRIADGALVDEMTISYYLYYHSNFDWGSTTGFKQVFGRSDASSFQSQLITGNIGSTGRLFIAFTRTSTGFLYSNVDGDATMPKGEWVHLKFHIKVSPEKLPDSSTNPSLIGTVQGWINGELRWDYSNIATIERGNYNSVNINPTFNQHICGSDQKRYWDQFTLSP